MSFWAFSEFLECVNRDQGPLAWARNLGVPCPQRAPTVGCGVLLKRSVRFTRSVWAAGVARTHSCHSPGAHPCLLAPRSPTPHPELLFAQLPSLPESSAPAARPAYLAVCTHALLAMHGTSPLARQSRPGASTLTVAIRLASEAHSARRRRQLQPRLQQTLACPA